MAQRPESLQEPQARLMAVALNEAKAAAQRGEVPVGAVVVYRGQVIAAAGNAPIGTHDPTAHAEILALRAAAQHLGNYRLEDCEIYVSLEPCAMCASAILQSRIKRLVFALPEPKSGAAGSVLNLFANPKLNHHTHVHSGLLAGQSRRLIQDFFKTRRQHKSQARARAAIKLRPDALRTPQTRFTAWPSAPMLSHYWSDLPGFEGWRVHGLCYQRADASQGDVVCLHGPQEWSLAWQPLCVGHELKGGRFVCPDLLGFGQSDKPKRTDAHTLQLHTQVLKSLIDCIGFDKVTLVVHPDSMPLAQALLRGSTKIEALQIWEMPALPLQARQAPFPDRGHRAGALAFEKLLSAQGT